MWWQEKTEKLRKATSSSFWLKNALSALRRDDLDAAYSDAQIVLDLLEDKIKTQGITLRKERRKRQRLNKR
jgi:hypothetical protein